MDKMELFSKAAVICIILNSAICSAVATPTSLSSGSSLQRLSGGTELTTAEYGANRFGSTAVAVAITNTSNYCNGVLVSPNTFVWAGINCARDIETGANNVSVGSVFYAPTNPLFDGQTLFKIGGTERRAILHRFKVSTIPFGSLAAEAKQYPRGSTPPPPGTECVALGYWRHGNATTYQLNYVNASITDYGSCATQFHLPQVSDGTNFCALTLDPVVGGNNSICAADFTTIIMCKAWAGVVRVPDSDRTRLCLLYPGIPWCQLVCRYSNNIWPFCTDTPADDQWYLGGILANDANVCERGRSPNLFNYYPNLTFS